MHQAVLDGDVEARYIIRKVRRPHESEFQSAGVNSAKPRSDTFANPADVGAARRFDGRPILWLVRRKATIYGINAKCEIAVIKLRMESLQVQDPVRGEGSNRMPPDDRDRNDPMIFPEIGRS